ncbi:lipopolysaccharide heptosyltransferase I [Achromobacter mucicolens]|jgi:heptosyltransferase-1|uniref:Lipopolysaccharide heptosyltransferase 1 n=1 Tax=Achromobacter mucicolens TaxID=1389922 RepID=A0ABD4YND3_9BURK|nr:MULTISPECIES: lipopolysaccharide heptosyltransferase I [Achromobacter]KXJ66900.1 heptosyltransferase [Achromobacter xylosoxidans]MCP2514182.1 lipopolysaccharide heptosyltransferase I [Achromobacter mucicolens]MDF2864548.1 waaC [Achromobacter mucicolens]MDG9969493.1 lipopolysaccharide heptosyltransferase I [Achromobacter mucicolens]MDH1176957.1 lipopolysaccharide heptosyltransferase I [Achromobacter mucicolens]
MPTRILIVRTSSLGDLVHMLPAITDIARHVPDAQIDWVVEEAFAEIPTWHPAVNEVIKVAHRRWRKSWWSAQVRAERRALRERLRAVRYDIVLDMQALLKSAWLVRQTQGVKHGLDWRSAREPLASLFYNVRHRVEFWQPAVIRQRKLAGLTFGYQHAGLPDFGLQSFARQATQAPEPVVEVGSGGLNAAELPRLHHLDTDRGYAVIMPSASRDDKLWPEEDWRVVFRRLREAGCTLKLLAGNEQEAERAQLLVAGMEGAEVMPRMDLTAVAKLLAGARLMVGLDSGLTHLSAALGRPTIGIYRASTPVRTPLVGSNYTASLGDRGASPSREAVMASVEQALAAQ